MPKLVNLGSLCIDNVYSVPNITAAGETVASLEYAVYAGGKGLNQSLAAARAGARVAHVGCVGPDGLWLRQQLAEAGVDVAALREGDCPSGHAVIQVNPSGENAIVISGGANRTLEDADIDAAFDLCDANDWLLLQNEINKMEDIFERSSRYASKLALNLAPVDDRIRGYDLSAVDLLIVNEVEAQALAGETSVADALEALCVRYPSCEIVLTLGRDGLRLWEWRRTAFTRGLHRTGGGRDRRGGFVRRVSHGGVACGTAHVGCAALGFGCRRPGDDPSRSRQFHSGSRGRVHHGCRTRTRSSRLITTPSLSPIPANGKVERAGRTPVERRFETPTGSVLYRHALYPAVKRAEASRLTPSMRSALADRAPVWIHGAAGDAAQ